MAKVIQEDIAREVGVSIATVSRVLSGKTGPFSVSSKVTKRIQETARRLGYHVNIAGRSLRTKRFQSIGLLFFSTVEPIYGNLVPLLQSRIYQRDYSSVCGFWTNEEDAVTAIRAVASHGIDGIITCHDSEVVRSLVDDIPTSFLFSSDPTIDNISDDVDASLSEAIRYLVSLGHRKICLVGYFSTLSISLALKKYQDIGLNISQIQYSARSDVPTPSPELILSVDKITSCALDQRPTAIIARDLTAVFMMSELQRRGFSIPLDFSIVGINATKICEWVYPTITSIGAPIDVIADELIESLFLRFNDPDSPPRSISISSILQVRDSTAAPSR